MAENKIAQIFFQQLLVGPWVFYDIQLHSDTTGRTVCVLDKNSGFLLSIPQ